MIRVVLLLILLPGGAFAFERVSSKANFLALIAGKDLHIALYALRLSVSPDGRISGEALGRAVTGEWAWRDGYFCRAMRWGDEVVPYNCQLVEARPGAMRFTTDRGAGRSAQFGLR